MLKLILKAALLGAITAHALVVSGQCGKECLAADICCWSGGPERTVCSAALFDRYQTCTACIAALLTPISSDDKLNLERMRDGACNTWSYCNSYVSPLDPPSGFTEACASVTRSLSVSVPSSTSSSTSSQQGSMSVLETTATPSASASTTESSSGSATPPAVQTTTSSGSASATGSTSASRSQSVSSAANASATTSRPSGAAESTHMPMTFGGLALVLMANWVVM
ncbi:hypothetical protein Q8F55_005998 [Vanrija albida]|uniref:Extracellular membrane protein CFEM domain-containing protein n=1 Tax=Vanrija albida TaxID=181172 RepID=A0ABR3Q3D8_9TREE